MSSLAKERAETLKAQHQETVQQTESEFRALKQKKHQDRILAGDVYKARKALESLDEKAGVERWEMWVPVVVNGNVGKGGVEEEEGGVHSGHVVYNTNLHQMISEQEGMQNEVVELENEEKERLLNSNEADSSSEFEALEVKYNITY